MKAPDFAKYLRRHPAPEGVPRPDGFRRAVVIPAWDENAELPAVFASLAAALRAAPRPVATIAVVNHPPGSDPAPSLELMRRIDAGEFRLPGLFSVYAPDLKGGVGAARALGIDLFLSAQTAESVGDTLIWSLDADSPVGERYFSAVEEFMADHPGCGAATLGFSHRAAPTPEEERAIRDYEMWMRNHAAALRAAGSPYAFIALGSAIVCRGTACVRAGGMKRRTAGEDFYFLQELVKCGGVEEIPEVLVHPSPRLSARVPFGTGPAMRRMLADGGAPETSSPAAYGVLAALLAAAAPDALESAEALNARIPAEAREFLAAERFSEVWPRILANLPPGDAARIAAWHRWFDGLKTLRLLHWCDRQGR